MSTPEINAGVSSLTHPEGTTPIRPEVKEASATHDIESKSTIAKALAIALRAPKEIQIIIEQTSISVVFILGDMLVVWLVGLAFTDTIRDIPFIGYFYDGIKIASVLVITIRYLFNCIIDMNRSRKEFLSELKVAKPSEDR